MSSTQKTTRLRFYDQARMGYSKVVPPKKAGEFLVNGLDGPEAAEFTILLHDFKSVGQRHGLTPQITAFGDSTATLTEFIRVGGLTILNEVESVREFTKRLVSLGLTDRSELAEQDGGESR